MIYAYLKILHIISASLIVGSIFYSCHLWLGMRKTSSSFSLFNRIQKQTALIIIPATLVQLATGFTLISLKRYDLTIWWITTTLTGFIALIISWLGFIYFLSSSQQKIEKKQKNQHEFNFYRNAQSVMLLLCGLSIAIMIYLMANRFGSSGN